MAVDVFDVYAKLTLDTKEYDKGIDDAKDKANVFADVLGANLVTKGIGLAIDGLKKLGEAAVDVFKQAMTAYADYEQLVGGVETLFKDSADTVLQYAQGAYKTAGISANEYMETVTSFSASLLQSLGGDTQKAANMADMAITDMSDNANKMGTAMSSIQAAYQGFAKQNYTMLDNLKLGYGGTKEEMERLLEDAEGLLAKQGELRDFSVESYADIVEAIHVVQKEMGITGTTAKEGSTTISGSINTVKAAWKNLLADLGNGNADIKKDIDELYEAAENAWTNIEPVAMQVLDHLIEMLVNATPKFLDLGAKIAWAIIKGILTSPLRLFFKILEGLGLDVLDQSDYTGMASGKSLEDFGYKASSPANSTPYVPQTETVSTTNKEKQGGWGMSYDEIVSQLNTSGRVTININGDVYDDERSMSNKLRNGVMDVLDEELS